MKKILIVDDEQPILQLLTDHFGFLDYEILTAFNGAEALKQAEKQPDLILLDINMPELNGLEVCRKIRHIVSCPILFVTAKVDEADKIKGLQVGGDDYITKPFSLAELTARVEAHLRRDERHLRKTKVSLTNDLEIDYDAKELYFQGTAIHFTKKEFEIIELLATYKGQVFDKERIYEKLWGFDGEGDSMVISEHIRKIRAKFTKLNITSPIETVWGVGYKWKS